MRNHIGRRVYIIGFLLVCILVLFSLEYRNTKKTILHNFPIDTKEGDRHGNDPILFIYIFFSGNDCSNCLEVIDVLNNLPSQFKVIGVVPNKDLANEINLREKTKAKFDLISFSKSQKRFIPNYSPSIFGVGEDGKIYFVMPGVPGEKEYFENFLINLYSRIMPLLIKNN